MKTAIINARVIMPTGIYAGEVMVENGVITEVALGHAVSGTADMVIDAAQRYLSPGFIDVHTHGAGGADFVSDNVEDIYTACRTHLQHGTTSIVPTTTTGSKQQLLDFVELFNTIELCKDGLPEILGLHLEGPYFADSQRGAQNPAFLRNPEPEEYEEVLRRTNRILRWSFAVELPGADKFLSVLRKAGIVSSVAHSDATCAEVLRAYENGVSALTHFYSGMSGVRRINAYRVGGVIEAGYLLDELMVEVIADGCHLPAELLQLIYKVKGADKICLVTDSMSAAGMPEGEYTLGGIPCIVEDSVAKLLDRSAFAGSVATTDRLVRTFHSLTTAPLYEVVKMMTLNPAKLVHMEARKGSIAPGKDADLLLFDDDIQVSMVMVRGQTVAQ